MLSVFEFSEKKGLKFVPIIVSDLAELAKIRPSVIYFLQDKDAELFELSTI